MSFNNSSHLLPPQEDLPLRHFSDQSQQPPPPPQQRHFSETPSLVTASFLNHPSTLATTESDLAPPHRNGDNSAADANPRWLSFHTEIQNTGEVRSEVVDGVNADGETILGVVGGEDWRSASYKAAILRHPMYEQLLAAHVACLRVATPVDQIPRIDAQLSQLHTVADKYSTLGVVVDNKELDHFMSHYVVLLCSFKEQLQHHVCVHAMEAITACWEIEQSLQSLTGVSPSESNGKTMSDDEDDNQVDSEVNMFDGSLDGSDCLMGFGPLVPTERERSLMERVKKELKHELKQGFKEKIVDIREEIMRKRRAGKLPGDTTSVLKEWWRTHSKWPYPTEEDKAKLVQETGLQLKQINNWFINQRKRNWNSNTSTSSTLSKNKRKRTDKS
ncbi:PREDICTED: homeobox protein knotted-1-like 5 isoform X1 [Camelina sativa]|uniref:Homeobox protein knotted-1-like 5 isoform X1 n=2 Tax=Camelina sativa TaxID=90675 RepID=A0ABM0U9L4_CAMSA|nr:PREDICTED: homeobox protein knotted-1-like 5 isoform X1 [Camelina sativa]